MIEKEGPRPAFQDHQGIPVRRTEVWFFHVDSITHRNLRYEAKPRESSLYTRNRDGTI